MMKRICVLVGCATMVLLAACLSQPDPAVGQQKQKGKAKKKFVTRNLDNPCGIAVQPGTNHLLVATQKGVYRIDINGEKKKKRRLEIKGYPVPTDIYGKGPKYAIGPLGLAFLDKNHLIVGDGSRKDGDEYVKVYEVGNTMPKKAQQESKAKYTLGPISKSDKTANGEGNFYGVAYGAGSIFVSCNGDDTKGWVAQSVVKNGKPGTLELSIATKVATSVDAPVPVTFSKDDKELVVGQMGEITIPKDSLLTFYDPATGKLNRKLKTTLYDITGLAYSPKTGKLYATDFAWMDTKKGGLFCLEVNGDDVTATKIMRLDKPTALAFDSDGNLFITVIGTAKEGSKKAPGGVVMVNAGL